jgi:hypothetical protein
MASRLPDAGAVLFVEGIAGLICHFSQEEDGFATTKLDLKAPARPGPLGVGGPAGRGSLGCSHVGYWPAIESNFAFLFLTKLSRHPRHFFSPEVLLTTSQRVLFLSNERTRDQRADVDTAWNKHLNFLFLSLSLSVSR